LPPSERRIHACTRRAIAVGVVALISATATRVCFADDLGQVIQELASAGDFRVRVNAALVLGHSHDERAPAALATALDDAHPAVRAAAAAGLGALGQPKSLPVLRQRASRERKPQVRSQLRAAIVSLEGVASAASGSKPRASKVRVKLGQLQNLSGVRGAQLSALFRGATRARAGALPGVEVLSDTSEAWLAAGAEPVLLIDGVVVRLVRASEGERISVSAEVEYVFRKMPEHALRGSISGAAKALGGTNALSDRARVAVLENQALEGAVDSAMRGAPEAMVQALR
jgi:hypothetical protein